MATISDVRKAFHGLRINKTIIVETVQDAYATGLRTDYGYGTLVFMFLEAILDGEMYFV